MLILNDAKEVKYFGFSFYVPNYVNYIAFDKSGDGYGYEEEPVEDGGMFYPDDRGEGKYCLISEETFTVTGDWKLSLQKV